MVEDDVLLGSGLKQNMENILQTIFVNPIPSKQWPMVIIKDVDSSVADKNNTDNDFSIFPPSNHENLFPSHFKFDPQETPSPPLLSPSSSLSLTSSLSPSSSSSSQPSDFDSPPPPPSLLRVPTWWDFAFQILRSKIATLGSYIVGRGGNRRLFWPFGNLSLVVMAVVWWLSVRLRQRWARRGESVGHLLRIIKEKDEKIVQLLNQIAQMNEVLLARHKVLASKNG